ncbi:HlyD family efflux transporter periplasmic adaptor subunit [Pseudomonas sp. FSL R10-1350]|jgi:membrane fusion protein (multidrug efflux system)|uniref:HlyD family efflux transporter periplasmic adaptor subunit n=1 Tax=Pseudomonas helleri TaxID=1608996 RepID=A0A6A7YAG1_9PSED|nr:MULTISPECIES: HlyD family efflux transporter periplasmic adaptor subunit [Pseudomonas]KMN23506.1 hemolysin D [Pseudomonas helleri]MQT29181.1 HlyD family efflux transporter periplasmic adaptor subunit [Pseudomonas helleri]MQT39094.1 HlyD family efflux transporter periplasmic adaptor subunit [Pseudomonas helleri]MQT45431.1 HlyD family efflux transporter periplasmic adaptor subunit [Pseudomonas helleri]MQT91468.1 HlyD family efflux transporter periplasmic adaptor subunit [Pseudomonas helleri]
MATVQTPNEAQHNQDAGNQRKRKLWLSGLAILVILVGLGVWGWHELYGRWSESTDDAYVNGNVVEITPLVAGTVVSIGADDGDLVHEGQVLLNFDPSDSLVGLQSAEANLARTVRQVRGLFSNVSGTKAQVAAQKVAVQKAQDNFNRRKNLAASGAISQEELSHARDDLASAQSALRNNEQQLDTTSALVDNTAIANHPDVLAAAAQLRQAYLEHARTTLIAPVTGYVAKRTVQLGQRVQPGTALMAVIPLNQLWIDANFKETQLDKMRIGQPVEIESDLYGSNVKYSGTVDSIGAGTGSAFALLPAQNATGNWIKIVQRVPVRIHINADELAKHPLRIGLSTTVDVNLHDQSGPVLAQQPPQKAMFTTNVYEQQLAEADTLISRLIESNSAVAGTSAAQR